jgi:pyrophosphatase PpaX
VTSKLRDDALAELAVTALDAQIDALVAFEDTSKHKPYPDPNLKALAALNANAGIGVSDLPTDLASARAAGLEAIGVSWGYGTATALLNAGAACVCDTVAALAREIERRT